MDRKYIQIYLPLLVFVYQYYHHMYLKIMNRNLEYESYFYHTFALYRHRALNLQINLTRPLNHISSLAGFLNVILQEDLTYILQSHHD